MPAKEPFTPCPIDLDLTPSPSSPDAMLESAQMAEVERLCRAAMPEVVGALIGIATGTRRKSKPNTDGIFETELNDEGEPILENWTAGPRVTAGNAVLQYGYGRPTQKVNHTGDQGGGLTIVIKQISDGTTTEVINVTPTPEANVIADRATEPVGTP